MTRVLLIASAMVLLGLLVVPLEADALPKGAVGYKVYHDESGEWVRYSQGDPFPPGGADPGTNTWKYKYCAENVGYPGGIYQFLIFFNSDNKDTAQYVSYTFPANWGIGSRYFGPIAPDANWKVRFRADGEAYYIAQSDTLCGFEVEFTWVCPTMLPPPQNYDLGAPGGSEPGVTHELPPDVTPVETTTWGRLKGLFFR